MTAGYHEIHPLRGGISWYTITAMIDRQSDLRVTRTALRRSRVVALLRPRQCGKTTLARQFVPGDSLNYFDLEGPQSLARLSEPDIALPPLKELVVIDEIQRRPELFPLLRSPCGSETTTRSIPDSRQRFARSAQPILGDIGGASGNGAPRRLSPRRSGSSSRGSPLRTVRSRCRARCQTRSR